MNNKNIKTNAGDEDSARFRDKTKEHYDDVKDNYEEGMRNMAEYRAYCQDPVILKGVGDLRGKSLLDLGCGNGEYTRKFRNAGADPVVGSDLSQGMIDLALSREEKEPLGIEYSVDDLYNLKETRTFDIVTAVHLIHYMRHPVDVESGLRSIYSRIREGGKFVTFMANPTFDLGSHDPQDSKTKMGYYFTKADPENGGEFNFHPGGFDHINLVFYRWHQNFMEELARKTGYSKVEWMEPFVSEEGLAKYGEEYFENHITNPQGKLLILYK
jgi:2-polyprenyl-3-methyl-5-hydroxy-6-metoxy-1,4-benzoquinol methylase